MNGIAGRRVSDDMTREDRAIYDRMPLVGRLMVHRDRRDARIMFAHSIAADIEQLAPSARIAHTL